MDSAPKMGAGLQIVRRWRVLDTLREHGVLMLTSLQNIEIKRDCVIAQKSDGRPVKIYADQIIVAKGASGDLRFANELREAGHVVHEIGDCTGIHYIEGAMRSAAEVSKII